MFKWDHKLICDHKLKNATPLERGIDLTRPHYNVK
jgi:hypothetical protein